MPSHQLTIRFLVAFLSPVYALTQKSADDSNSFAFVSKLNMDCTCRCSMQNKVTTVLKPIPGKTDECEPATAARNGWYCDFMGDSICSLKPKSVYKRVRDLPNGNVRCRTVTSDVTHLESPFFPTGRFLSKRKFNTE
jgi:hypothetical protein